VSVRPALAAVLLAAAFAGGTIVGDRSNDLDGLANRLLGREDPELTGEALEVISDNYFEEVEPAELEQASVRGMVNQLRARYDDRFSHYFGPHGYARFREVTEGRFSGVGLSVNEVRRGLRVTTVFDDSPAQEAGIRVGDLITAVDGRSIVGEDAELATARIKGRPGTGVKLTVLPAATGVPFRIRLERASLELPVVEGSIVRVRGVPVAHVRLLGFSSGAHDALREKIEELYRRGAEGLVLDLRGNGGGLLTEAVLTSSLFVEEGVIVSTEGRVTGRETYDAEGDALPDHPTVVLINGDTASAAEILTAALRDAGLAKVVGERSFGKGTFQQVIPLENGGALDLTIGQYLARNGESLAGVGIAPDVPARDLPATEPDEGLRAALAALAPELPKPPRPQGAAPRRRPGN
jgi:carboxyl-terminal processing protease